MKEVTLLRDLVIEFGVPQGVIIVLSDSRGVILLTKNDAYHSKIKHISVKYYYIRDTIVLGKIVLKKIYTLENPIDMLTKSLPLVKIEHCLDSIGVNSILLPFRALPFGMLRQRRILLFGILVQGGDV